MRNKPVLVGLKTTTRTPFYKTAAKSLLVIFGLAVVGLLILLVFTKTAQASELVGKGDPEGWSAYVPLILLAAVILTFIGSWITKRMRKNDRRNCAVRTGEINVEMAEAMRQQTATKSAHIENQPSRPLPTAGVPTGRRRTTLTLPAADKKKADDKEKIARCGTQANEKQPSC